jgi:hypothetical protein
MKSADRPIGQSRESIEAFFSSFFLQQCLFLSSQTVHLHPHMSTGTRQGPTSSRPVRSTDSSSGFSQGDRRALPLFSNDMLTGLLYSSPPIKFPQVVSRDGTVTQGSAPKLLPDWRERDRSRSQIFNSADAQRSELQWQIRKFMILELRSDPYRSFQI